MITEIKYVNIRELLSRLTRHPLLQDLTIEQAIQYTIDFISIFGLPKMYMQKEITISIEEYRGILPCDLVSIIQVKDNKTNKCIPATSSTFNINSNIDNTYTTFKIQNNVIYTSFKSGELSVLYNSIPVDEDGYPLLLDNSVFLKALELYIKKEAFTVLFDLGQIHANVYENVLRQYGGLAGQLKAELTMPSLSEMESITRMWNSLILDKNRFEDGFINKI